MFSPPDKETGFPKPLFDGWTGAIDRSVVSQWREFDISLLVRENWKAHGPIITDRVRLVCGTKDSFYLNRAVAMFKEEVDQLKADSPKSDPALSGNGYIELIEGADHGSVSYKVHGRWQKEVRAFFQEGGFKQD